MPNQNTTSWTEEREEELRRLWGLEYSCSRIAEIIGGTMTAAAIAGKARRMKLPFRAQTDIARRRAAEMKARLDKAREAYAAENIAPVAQSQHPIVYGLPAAIVSLRGNPEAEGAAQCRFPVGFPSQADFHFCPNDRLPGRSYCAVHAMGVLERVRRKRAPTYSAVYRPRLSGMEKTW